MEREESLGSPKAKTKEGSRKNRAAKKKGQTGEVAEKEQVAEEPRNERKRKLRSRLVSLRTVKTRKKP